MDKKENVTEQLQKLISEYDFNVDTLSKYLGLSIDIIKGLSQGKVDILPDLPFYRFEIFNRISFLYFSAIEDKDLKLRAFLEVLISHHGLSKKTIAKMAGVETSNIERLLSYPPKAVTDEIKYKVAITVMALRFFLKECEPKPKDKRYKSSKN